MLKKIFFTLLALILVAILYVWHFVLPIPTGYAAKNLCSCLFVDGYNETMAESQDLHFSLVGMTTNSVDYEHKTVCSTFFGLQPQVAVYRNSKLGCTLMDHGSFNEIALPPIREDTMAMADSSHYQMLMASPEEQAAINAILAREIRDSAFHTRALLVLHHGKIAGERYAESFDSNSLFTGWSMTKSVMATLIGVLVEQGKINIDDPVPVDTWKNDPVRHKITWKNMLQMNTGLYWNEVYSWRSNATRMLYMEGDIFNFTTGFGSEFKPGTHWKYSSGTTNMLAGLLRQVIADDQRYHALPFSVLAGPIGMDHFVMETDKTGNFVGSSYSHATAREWARFGQLYLNRGIWNGHRIFPDWWADFVSTPAPNSNGLYGGHFWLNQDGHLPDVSRDMYYADGFMDQRVFILPAADMVVVRLGWSLHKQPDFNRLLKDLYSVAIHY